MKNLDLHAASQDLDAELVDHQARADLSTRSTRRWNTATTYTIDSSEGIASCSDRRTIARDTALAGDPSERRRASCPA
jgi:hypothetical protein